MRVERDEVRGRRRRRQAAPAAGKLRLADVSQDFDADTHTSTVSIARQGKESRLPAQSARRHGARAARACSRAPRDCAAFEAALRALPESGELFAARPRSWRRAADGDEAAVAQRAAAVEQRQSADALEAQIQPQGTCACDLEGGGRGASVVGTAVDGGRSTGAEG